MKTFLTSNNLLVETIKIKIKNFSGTNPQCSAYNRLEVRKKIIMREPYIAGILSLFVPGVGQIYNGRIVIGIVWLLLTGVSWIGSAGLLGWVVHIIAAWCAYSYAKENPIR